MSDKYFFVHTNFLKNIEDIILNGKKEILLKEADRTIGRYLAKSSSDIHISSENFLLYLKNKEFEKAYDI